MLSERMIREALPGLPLAVDAPMCDHTSFRIGGPADLLAMPRGVEELSALLTLAERHETPVLRMGNGTNLLISDQGIRGLVVKTCPGLAGVRRRGACEIVAGAGALLSRISEAAAEWGLSDMAFAHGIPGTVGGALVMNAGAYGGEISQVVAEAWGMEPNGALTPLISGERLNFSYRQSYFSQHPEVTATACVFCLTPGDPEAIRRDMTDLAKKRRASQPLEIPSAGSVFMRPPGGFAGSLIDSCGLKGHAIGGAQVSEKHAGFIVNRGGATCEEVKQLIAYIQGVVWARCGVELKCELKFAGDS